MGGTLELPAKAPAQINIYLQFEIWNQASKTFETLPKDVPVELMDHFTSPIPDYPIDKKYTDDKGCVHFIASVCGRRDDPESETTRRIRQAFDESGKPSPISSAN